MLPLPLVIDKSGIAKVIHYPLKNIVDNEWGTVTATGPPYN